MWGILSGLGRLGSVLLGGAAGAASGREKEADLNLKADTLRQKQIEADRQNALDAATLDVKRRTTGQDLESQARRQAVFGGMMQAGPRSYAPPPNIAARMATPVGGGITGADEIGKQAYDAAMQRLVSGSDKQYADLPTYATPGLTPMPKASKWDKLLSIAGLITGGIGAFAHPKQKPDPTDGGY